MSVKAKVTLIDGMNFVGVANSGHEVIMDAAPEVGGQNKVPRLSNTREHLALFAKPLDVAVCRQTDDLKTFRMVRHNINNIPSNRARRTQNENTFFHVFRTCKIS